MQVSTRCNLKLWTRKRRKKDQGMATCYHLFTWPPCQTPHLVLGVCTKLRVYSQCGFPPSKLTVPPAKIRLSWATHISCFWREPHQAAQIFVCVCVCENQRPRVGQGVRLILTHHTSRPNGLALRPPPRLQLRPGRKDARPSPPRSGKCPAPPPRKSSAHRTKTWMMRIWVPFTGQLNVLE